MASLSPSMSASSQPGAAPVLPASASAADVKEALHRDGFAILPNVISHELCDKLLGRIDSYINKGSVTRVLVQDFHGEVLLR